MAKTKSIIFMASTILAVLTNTATSIPSCATDAATLNHQIRSSSIIITIENENYTKYNHDHNDQITKYSSLLSVTNNISDSSSAFDTCLSPSSTTTTNTTSDHPHSQNTKIDYKAHEIPFYLQRPFIRARYRAYMTIQDCIESMFQIHNETAQIWSHLLPALYFWYKAFRHCFHTSSKTFANNQSRRYLFTMLCAAFATVFSASTFAHTFNPIGNDEDWFLFCWKVDWSAIAFAIFGATYTLATLAFHHDRKRMLFWRIIFAIASSIFLICCSSSLFQALRLPLIKISIVAFPGISVFAFMFDLKNQLKHDQWKIIQNQVLKGPLLLAIVGCTVYGAQFPERYFPDVNFDMIRGHHLFHHLWSACFAYMFVQNTLCWSKQIDNTSQHK